MSRIAPVSAGEVARSIGASVVGDSALIITSLASLQDAAEGSLSFYGSTSFKEQFLATRASCLLVRESDTALSPCSTMIVVEDPYTSFVAVVGAFAQPAHMPEGVRAASAVISATAQVHDTASIGPGCVIGDDCIIGEHVQLVANVVVYPRTVIGDGTIVNANVTMYSDTQIGRECIVHAGVVLGADGFGYVQQPDGSYLKIPQIGNVVIGDNVEIGANVTIDRAALGSTHIGNGVKIDNLVQIAHGVVVGEHTAIAAQAGISGGAVLGKRNRVAGQVGIAGHISVADDVVVMGQSGVTKSITSAGVYSGTPAQPHARQLRNDAALRDILQMQQKIDRFTSVAERFESKEES
jgi:UDP-3-O-[3-hydroxymyristoyl] glucosamine N-acyltransferase